jgi:hypothetical protein
MLHLTKLAVGVRDIAHLRALQAERAQQNAPLCHRTRSFPRRAPEVVDGGSIYWVVQGSMLVRQRILDIVEDRWDDGSTCAALILDTALVSLAGRATRPFQGWRYLLPEAAPPDLGSLPEAQGEEALPPPLRAALRELALL